MVAIDLSERQKRVLNLKSEPMLLGDADFFQDRVAFASRELFGHSTTGFI